MLCLFVDSVFQGSVQLPLLIYNFVIVIFEVSTKKFQYDFNYRQYIVVKNVGFRMKKKKTMDSGPGSTTLTSYET